MASLLQRVAVVTVGSGALGRVIVERLKSEGASVAVFDVNPTVVRGRLGNIARRINRS